MSKSFRNYISQWTPCAHENWKDSTKICFIFFIFYIKSGGGVLKEEWCKLFGFSINGIVKYFGMLSIFLLLLTAQDKIAGRRREKTCNLWIPRKVNRRDMKAVVKHPGREIARNTHWVKRSGYKLAINNFFKKSSEL